jgi:hypothetical protein
MTIDKHLNRIQEGLFGPNPQKIANEIISKVEENTMKFIDSGRFECTKRFSNEQKANVCQAKVRIIGLTKAVHELKQNSSQCKGKEKCIIIIKEKIEELTHQINQLEKIVETFK